MRPRFRILIAFLLFPGLVNTVLPQSDSDPNVVFSLKEWAHWAPVVGVDDPAFTLYDNRDLIYYNMSSGNYEYVRLTGDEYARVIEEVIPKDLPALEHWYMRTYATCQNQYYFYFGGEYRQLVTVYGHPTDDDWLYSYNIPQSLRRCFNMVAGYRNRRAAAWFPEKFEVLVWDMFPSNRDYPEWPSDWPDLNSPDTIMGTEVHSIFLPSELFDEFIALGDQAGGIVMINGKPMCIWYRTPIPGEEVFDRQFEEPDYENTPLHDAVKYGTLLQVKSLLAGGADIDAQRADGKTALHLAVEKGYIAAAELLISNGADIEARTLCGNTPLLCALDLIEADAAGVLLENGADVGAVNSLGDSPIHCATDDILIDTSGKLIAGGSDVNARNVLNETPLYCAARDGATAVVELLLAEGAEINAAKPDGRTALHAAAFHNHIEIVELLIANGADTNAETTGGHPPLDYAIMAGRDEIAELLQSASGREGEIVFCFEADGQIISTPAIGADSTVYFGTQNATLHAVDPNGKLKWKWKYDTDDWGPLAFEAAPVIGDDGTIYVADDIAIPNYLFAISPEGEKKWEYVTYVVYGSMDA
ncbi:MAG: ankyrin repeat domain-containing protein, partial [Planctomycetota bacterium]